MTKFIKQLKMSQNCDKKNKNKNFATNSRIKNNVQKNQKKFVHSWLKKHFITNSLLIQKNQTLVPTSMLNKL